MSDPRLITDEELAALRAARMGVVAPYLAQVIDAILARNPAPWEPSEDDITAYCEAYGWGWRREHRVYARSRLIDPRKRGWDAVPRRIEGGSHE